MSKKILMAAADAAAAKEEDAHTLIALRDWIKTCDDRNNAAAAAKVSLIQKVTVAYGIVELLIHCPENNVVLYNNNDDDDAKIETDNFEVKVRKKEERPSSSSSRSFWEDVRGVSMKSSGLFLSIEESSYLSSLFDDDDDEGEETTNDGKITGRYLEVELLDASNSNNNKKKDCHRSNSADVAGKERMSVQHCHYLLAKLLYQLFTHETFPVDTTVTKHPDDDEDDDNTNEEPLPKKQKKMSIDVSSSLLAMKRMQQLGLPASICRMVQNLFDSSASSENSGGARDAYKTLGEVGKDLHLLLFDPERFLFDKEEAGGENNMQLLYRKEKLYGRDKEETLITDTFCRVTRGKSEAFFIGGFSGSGKSMLVDTLRVRVNYVGGYVIKHKFDAISQDRPLSGVISAVNQLCFKIKNRLSSQRLAALSKKLRDDFGADIGLLARMLPNISCVLSPEFGGGIHTEKVEDGSVSDKMQAQSVSFTLLRFIRLVSSPTRPIMLFLDDLQWADDTALDVIHTFLSDKMGSCMFFVGTYRDNEVQVGDALFDLMEKLEISNVPTNKVSLTGLDEENVNEMISDALCLYPRITKSLSDIVFQKTKGNPFFVLEFMQSLQSRGLLQYDSSEKRWVWDEDTILAEEITDNVLHLLSKKMNRLSKDMQLLLKVMACFGTSTDESVIDYLSESPEYAGVRKGLEGAINDGFVEVNAEGKFKFVHDKVREAAYDLIPDKDKRELHYHLGKTLFSICEGKDTGGLTLLIASQINHGKETIEKDDALCMPVVKLNMMAGQMALDGCDHKMAYVYFLAAASLISDDSWESYYDLTLRLNFFMARAANSSCKYDEAELTLRTIFERARCLKDKLPAYFLLAEIFVAQGRMVEAYTTCSSILTQLGEESVPETVTPEKVRSMIPETFKMYAEVYGDDLLRKEKDNSLCYIMKFYSIMATAAHFFRPSHITVYIVCKMVQLSLRHGVCPDTPIVMMQLSSIVVSFDNVAFVRRMAQNAMVLAERFGLSDETAKVKLFFHRGCGQFDSYHVGAAQLRKLFPSCLSSGNANIAFYCASQGAQFSTIGAEKDLTSLLKEMDYYLHQLETYKSEMSRYCLLCYRETISTLIDKGQTTAITARLAYADVSDPGNKLLEVFYFHQVFRNFWLGYSERCQHYVHKYGEILRPRHFESYIIKFYHGLNTLDMMRKKKAKTINHAKLVEVGEIIKSLRVAASHAESNFSHKLELLEAENNGFHHHHYEARKSYDAAIKAARKNKFIHEQGLSCEKAGLYYKSMHEHEKALEYLKQSRECYEKWGSSVKVEFIERELQKLNDK